MGGTEFFSTHELTAHAAGVACLDNLAALKLPLQRWANNSDRADHSHFVNN